jgi:hypothetical protein
MRAFAIDATGNGRREDRRAEGRSIPANVAPYVVNAWMVLGLVVRGDFWFTDRDRIAETGAVSTDEAGPPEDPSEADRVTSGQRHRQVLVQRQTRSVASVGSAA